MLSFATTPPLRQMSSPSVLLCSLAAAPPTTTRKATRISQYKARPVQRGGLPLSSPEAPAHERLLRQCEHYRARERARVRERAVAASSSDYDGDVNMDDEEQDARDIELLEGRIGLQDRRRAQKFLEQSFNQEVGTSYAMSDDELEALEDGPDDEELATLYEEYIQESNAAQPSSSREAQDAMMSDDLAAAPLAQSRLFASCPSCFIDWHSGAERNCRQCGLVLPLEDVASSWFAEHGHGTPTNPTHFLSLVVLPDGLLLVCGAPDCDWCFDLE